MMAERNAPHSRLRMPCNKTKYMSYWFPFFHQIPHFLFKFCWLSPLNLLLSFATGYFGFATSRSVGSVGIFFALLLTGGMYNFDCNDQGGVTRQRP